MLEFPSSQTPSPKGNAIGATDNQVAFNGALNNIYDAFGATADKEQISLLMACRIVNHFDELVSHDERQPGRALPSKLADALVPLMVSNKKEGDLVLCSQDFLAALDMLKTFTTDQEIRFVLDSCKNADMNSFLADGLKRYNNHPVAIGRNVQFQTTLIDCWQVLNNNQMLSPLDNPSLGFCAFREFILESLQ